MGEGLFNPPIIRAPAFPKGEWLNTAGPLSLAALRGRAVLIDIWEYSCVNCLRTLPYLRQWHTRYADKGLTIIGVHTPEFKFGREHQQLEAAVQELDIPYPVFLDNDYQVWDAYANRAWPSKYLIDPQGYIRYQTSGEGNYDITERAIQAILHESNPNLELPPIMQPLRAEDQPDAVCYRPTPELHTGLDRGALGNPEGYAKAAPLLYTLPRERQPGAFYIAGAWQAGMQYLVYQGQTEGLIQLPYEAVDVYAVFTPHVEALDRLLHPETVTVEIWQDDAPLSEARQGLDVTSDGRVLVDRPRSYHLVHNLDFERHELSLRIKTRGFAVYAFSFTGCVKKP